MAALKVGPYLRITGVNFFSPKDYVFSPASFGVFSTLNGTRWKVGGKIIDYPDNIGDGLAETRTKASRAAFLNSHSVWNFLQTTGIPGPPGEQKWTSGYAVGRAIVASGGRGSFQAVLSQNGVTIFDFHVSAPFTKAKLLAAGAFDFIANGGP